MLLGQASPQHPVPWDDLRVTLEPCLDQRESWRSVFAEDGIEFHYDRFDWRETALVGDTVDWDDYEGSSEFRRLDLRYSESDKRWFMFHRAANEQRVMVLRALRARNL